MAVPVSMKPDTPSTLELQSSAASLSAAIKSEALRLGFDLVGIAPAVSPPGFPSFQEWLRRGFSGEMAYLPSREQAYSHPGHVLETVRSVIMLGMNYRTVEPAQVGPGEGRVSRYAWGKRDYHGLLRERLSSLASSIHRIRPGCRTRGVVDTAPLLERDFARMAGLGWFGKNTLLLNKRMGSWLFLAALLVDLDLEYDKAHETSHCGTCTRCLDVCPTDAFPEPYVLDARKCIAYLNIELRGPIPTELRVGMKDWLFGCDLCQEVCPWNRKAPQSNESLFQPRDDLSPADARLLLKLSPREFDERFRGTPLMRPRRSGLLRNAAIVLGNSGSPDDVSTLCEALDDEEPLIRGAVAWALGRLGGATAVRALQTRLTVEDNPNVLEEILSALGPDEARTMLRQDKPESE
jgi:epoxyqueuosine reductase